MSNVVRLKKLSSALMQCTACGASAEAACDCGAPYMPAGERAAQAIEANPGMSDRAIAEQIGIGHQTVGRARKATGPYGPVAKRTGKDGKTRRAPQRKQQELVMPTEEEAEEEYQATCYDQACRLLEEMADATRQKYAAHCKRKYHEFRS